MFGSNLLSACGSLGAFFLVGASSAMAQGVRPVGPPPRAEGWRAVTVAQGIRNPWGIAWRGDGSALITGKYGTLHLFRNGRLQRVPIEGLPRLFTGGQGGLMDIAVHPQHSQNGLVYMTMSSGTERQNQTVLIRGKFDGERMNGVQTLYQAWPSKSGGQHFGSRILWLPDGTLLMSLGDGGNPPLRVAGRLARENGQRLDTSLGSIVRLTDEGRPAGDNPFSGRAGARPEIWSYGHRNIQGLTRDPATGRVWANEHGPRGGDELNLIQRGANYGWPRVTFGRDYRTGETIGATSRAGMVDPLTAWTPAHAPSGLAFYTGSHFPQWRGSLFSGGLASKDIRQIALDQNGRVAGQSRLAIGRRVRDVRQGSDGYLYLLTDEVNGRLMRIEPAR